MNTNCVNEGDVIQIRIRVSIIFHNVSLKRNLSWNVKVQSNVTLLVFNTCSTDIQLNRNS